MKRKMVVLLCVISMVILLSVYRNNSEILVDKAMPWSQSELDNLLDLEELGVITHDSEGHWFGNGRQFDFSYVQSLDISYGRDFNLLGLDESIYRFMKPEVEHALYLASADQLKTKLKKYHLSVNDIKKFRGDDQIISKKEFKELIEYLNTQNTIGTSSIKLGDKLIDEFGITKTILEGF